MGCCKSNPPSPEPAPPEDKRSSMKSYATKTEKPTEDYKPVSHPVVNGDNKPHKTESNEPKPAPNTCDIPTEAAAAPITDDPKPSNIPKTSTIPKTDELPPPTMIISPNSASFSGLYEIFTLYAKGHNSDKMDIDGLTAALKIFGLNIDINKHLQELIWSKFDLDNEKEIDFNDFMATLSSLVDSTNEDSLFLFFQIFDYDDSGFLEVDELAAMLFCQQKISAAVTNQPALMKSNTNQGCINRAKSFVTENDDNGDGKISFDEFNKWRKLNSL